MKQIITQLVSDLSGEKLSEGNGETVEFTLDGSTYELDLSKKEADKFRGLFQDYIAVARKTSGGRAKRGSSGSTRRDASQTKAIKEWADKQGMEYPQRGRLPQTLLDAYEAAHKS